MDKQTQLKRALQLAALASVILGLVVVGILRDTSDQINKVEGDITQIQNCDDNCIEAIISQLNRQSKVLSVLRRKFVESQRIVIRESKGQIQIRDGSGNTFTTITTTPGGGGTGTVTNTSNITRTVTNNIPTVPTTTINVPTTPNIKPPPTDGNPDGVISYVQDRASDVINLVSPPGIFIIGAILTIIGIPFLIIRIFTLN